MRNRLRSWVRLGFAHLHVVEAAFVGVFFIQALRFLIALLYSRIASASQYPALDLSLLDRSLPGLVEPSTVSGEITFVLYMLALPLLTVLIGRVRWIFVLATALTAVGRYLMVADTSISQTTAAAMTVGGGLVYISLLVRHRAQTLPHFFILALGIDQLFRAAGNTLDPSLWSADYLGVQSVLSFAACTLTLTTVIRDEVRQRHPVESRSDVSLDHGLLTVWGGLGLAGLLFLELALLTLPNAMLGRSDASYTLYAILVPFTLAATLLPLIPWVRMRARWLIGLFDSSVRGWIWLLILALLLVFGTRFQGIVTPFILVGGQLCAGLLWWWLARPQAPKERNLTGLWVSLGALVFALLIVGDIFTFEYAFVRDFADELAFLNDIVPPLLRGFRGLGLAVLLLSAFLAALPMVQTRRRIAWTDGSGWASLFGIIVVAVASIGAAIAARPPVVSGVNNPQEVRIATYNIHAGYNELFAYDLEEIYDTIYASGANIVLLQEVEAGRLTSFGVDEALWLARKLGMDARFYPTNEGLQGLAILSNIEIVYDDGQILPGVGTQTGLQRVQVRPDAGVITIYNTWLGVLLERGTDLSIEEQQTDQQRQLDEIFAIISAQNPGDQLGRSRTVIGGTFNNVPDSDLIGRLRQSGLVDPWAGAAVDLSATFWRTGQHARLDYLWITRNLPLVGQNVLDTHASDHRLAVIGVALR